MSKLSEFGLRVVFHENDDMVTAVLQNKEGKTVGEIEALFNDAINAHQVKMAYTLDSIPKGKGIGQEFYSALNVYIKRKGSKLASDFKKMQSDDARNLWSKFKKTGKASGPHQYTPKPSPDFEYDVMEMNEVLAKPNLDIEEIQERESFFKPVATKINQIANDLVSNGLGFGRKAFISDVAERLGIAVDKLAGMLVRFNQLDWIELERSDLRGDPMEEFGEKIEKSEIEFMGSSYNFIIPKSNSSNSKSKNEMKRYVEWRRRADIRWRS